MEKFIKIGVLGLWGMILMFGGVVWGQIKIYEKNIYEYKESNYKGMAEEGPDRKYGYINKFGVKIIEYKFDNFFYFSEGLARVKLDGKWGFINDTGQVIISLIYDYVNDFDNGLAVCKKNGKYGFIDKTGNIRIPFIYDKVGGSGFFNRLAKICKDDKWGFIDTSGKAVIPIIYDFIEASFFEGFTRVKKNENGVLLIQMERYFYQLFMTLLGFFEGIADIQKENKWGFIDKTGKLVIPFIYDETKFFSEGLAAVQKERKWGFVDKKGKLAIPFIFDDVWGTCGFLDGNINVQKDENYFLINKKGECI